MATSTRKRKTGDRGRRPYRFTADQLMKMIHAGIIGQDEDVELWDGIIYKMTKGELHNQIVILTALAVGRVIDTAAYHVREEKSNSDGPISLPEPDLSVVRREAGWLTPRPPELEEVALVAEVDHNTSRSDRGKRLSRYAERRIPVYWIIKATRGIVMVFDNPQGEGALAHYARTQRFSGAAEIPIVIDGREVGRIAAERLFPRPRPGA